MIKNWFQNMIRSSTQNQSFKLYRIHKKTKLIHRKSLSTNGTYSYDPGLIETHPSFKNITCKHLLSQACKLFKFD